MKVTAKYNQHRRDCWCDMECESCGEKQTYKSAYDDDNFWQNVVPSFKCPACQKSTHDLGLSPEPIELKHKPWEVV